MNNDSSQAFRNRTTGAVANIPTLINPKTGERIVLWKNIQSGFKNAESIWKANALVPFLTDENLEEMIPLRITYHPGVILDVVVDTTEQTISIREEDVPLPQNLSAGKESNGHDDQSNRTIAADIAENTTDQSLVVYTNGITEISQSFMLPHSPLHNIPLHTIMSGQATIKQSIDQHFDQLQIEMDKNKQLQEQIIQMQELQQHTSQELLRNQEEMRQMQELQQNTSQELLRNQEEMRHMQQRALDRLAIIQNSVQAVLTQTYELHEYPIPRLFIVLPKAVGKFKSLISDEFRLYFLCECGTHTMSDDSKSPHEVHLAKHEGYDLEQPTKFFERYGSYVLTLMQMIKYGIVAAGLVVPPLANFKILDGLNTAQGRLEHLKNIAPLVDDTIRFLQDIKSNNEMGCELATEQSELVQLRALEGADLRQLESYLNIKDQGRVLGNLYRIVTLEGHVKWVCFDHYKSSYRESAIRHIRDIVEVNGGRFVEEKGRIEIVITSNILAKQFYDAMVKARGIQELDITLKWDASMDDFRALSNAVTKANVIQLTVDGTHFKNPALDVINRSRRYDPILQLASNSRIQSLQLKAFDAFFSHVSKSALAPAPKFRVFTMESGFPSEEKSLKSFSDFLEQCSSLTTVKLKSDHQNLISKATCDILNKHHHLESLNIECREFLVSTSISNGKIKYMNMTIKRLVDLNSDGYKVAQQGYITRLKIASLPRRADQDRLTDILSRNPRLVRLEIGSMEKLYSVLNDTLAMKFQDLVVIATSRTILELESLKISCGDLSINASFLQGKIQDVDLTIGQLNELNSDYLKFIQIDHLRRLTIMDIPRKGDEDRLVDILRHGSRLTHLEIGCSTINNLKMRVSDLVKMVTLDILCKLESLKINCGGLSIGARFSQGKIQDVDLTIERLDELDSDYLKFIQKDQLSRLAIRYAPQEAYEGKMAYIFHSMPRLSHLQIGCKSERFLTIINLMITTRRKVVQDRGCSCLRSIDLVGENLVPFDIFGECDDHTYIQSHMSFNADSNSFDMRTWIRLQNGMSITNRNPVNDFIRQYGWSIVFFDEDRTENNTFAAILDNIPTTRASQLESFRFCSDYFKGDEFDRLDSIIRRSPNFKDLGLYVYLDNESDFKKAHSLLSRYGSMLSVLKLCCSYLREWLPRIASSFPTRNSFPNMVSLELGSQYFHSTLSNCVPWIVAMVSAPPQANSSVLHSQSLSQGIVDKHNAKSVSATPVSWTPLKKIQLRTVHLYHQLWKTVIESIDLSEVQHLDLKESNITYEAFKLLVDRIPDNNTSKVPFKTLDIGRTGLVKSATLAELQRMLFEGDEEE